MVYGFRDMEVLIYVAIFELYFECHGVGVIAYRGDV